MSNVNVEANKEVQKHIKFAAIWRLRVLFLRLGFSKESVDPLAAYANKALFTEKYG